MAWVDINSWTFTPQKDLTVHLQYDNASKTVTSVNVRVILTFPSGWYANSYSSDAYCLLWGNPSDNKTYNIKGPNIYWRDASPAVITVYKAYNSSTYTIPSFWVCVSGHELPFQYNGRDGYLSYGSGAGVTDTVYNWFKAGGNRDGYKLEVGSQTLSGGPTATSGSAATDLSVVDKGNNTFTINGKTAANSTNNPLVSTDIWYTTNGDDPALGTSQRTQVSISVGANTSFETSSISIPVSSVSAEGICQVRVGVFSYFTYGTSGGPIGAGTKGNVKYYTNMSGSPRISLTDNKNNTFTVSYNGCSAGTNNSITTTAWYSYNNNTWTTVSNSGTITLDSKKVADSTSPATIYLKVRSVPGWSHDSRYNNGNGVTVNNSGTVKNYRAPSSAPVISVSSSKGRFSKNETWTFTWNTVAAVNSAAEVRYRIRLLKNGTVPTLSDYSMTHPGVYDHWDTGDTTYPLWDDGSLSYDVNGNTHTFTLNPKLFTFGGVPVFSVGDKISLHVTPFIRNGVGTYLAGTVKRSDQKELKNAGILHVKVNNEWKEGQVWVKAGGTWHEAETVNVKVDGQWKESQ